MRNKQTFGREDMEMDADGTTSKGWIRKRKRVGPSRRLYSWLDRRGKIEPQTPLQSGKTKGKWVPMKTIDAAMKRWKASHPEESGD